MKEKIAVFGAGDLGREIVVLIRQISMVYDNWSIEGFYDDNIKNGSEINGVTVLGGIEELNQRIEPLNLVLAVADSELKKKLVNKISNALVKYPVLIHPSVNHDDFQNLKFGEGSIICAGNVFTTDIQIGSHVLLNLHCTVGHDCIIGDFSNIMPGVNISGKVTLEEGVYIGTGAKIINYVTIGKYTTIGAGATVVNNIESDSVAFGTPARIIRRKK